MSDDEFQLRKEAEDGSRAQQLLDSPLLKKAFSDLEAAYIEAWRQSDVREYEGRERLWQAVQIIGKVQAALDTAVSDGKVAEAALRLMESKRAADG